jgi:hypothetical protein
MDAGPALCKLKNSPKIMTFIGYVTNQDGKQLWTGKVFGVYFKIAFVR